MYLRLIFHGSRVTGTSGMASRYTTYVSAPPTASEVLCGYAQILQVITLTAPSYTHARHYSDKASVISLLECYTAIRSCRLRVR
jgi:hypothetical protein